MVLAFKNSAWRYLEVEIAIFGDTKLILHACARAARAARMAPARRARAGFRKFSGNISCIERARRARAGFTVYPPWIQIADV
jgi:hypothetical protein